MDKIKFQFTNLLFTFTSLVAIFLASMTAAAIEGLPAQPTDPAHPGSAIAPYEVERADFVLDGRSVEVFLPKSATGPQKYPLIVFGHGQALGVEHYRRTLEHLARKGVVAIHPQFDTGFFDRNWRRMADDYNRLTAEALSRYANFIAADQIVYSGHSKGAYVALVAAGAPRTWRRTWPATWRADAPAWPCCTMCRANSARRSKTACTRSASLCRPRCCRPTSCPPTPPAAGRARHEHPHR